MSELVHDIDFGSTGNSLAYVLDGIGTPEGVGGHSWSYGLQSTLRFTLPHPSDPHVIVMRARPWLHPPEIERQRVMIGLNDHLLATKDLVEDCAFALHVPPSDNPERVLLIGHVDSVRSAKYDVYRNGQSMGLMMRWLRVFRQTPRPGMADRVLPPLPGKLEDGSLVRTIEMATRRTMSQVVGRFESLGEWCEFGKLQQRYGADHPGLLRFAALHLPDLLHGLVRQFDGIAEPDRMTVFHAPATPNLYDVHDHTYRVWWHTGKAIDETNSDEIIRAERVRMPYLQRKFKKTLAAGERMFVLTTPASDDEAFAVFLALDLWARNVLLFVTQDGPHPPGSVELLGNGLMRGTIDRTDFIRRGSEGSLAERPGERHPAFEHHARRARNVSGRLALALVASASRRTGVVCQL